ncbi:zinc-binding dehydrogenase [Streptomyces sp. NBC_00503]|uniref:zinc-binding dehydrogenase n=1 Tax=Streptomyces sp. NBC_00503 TaxID=2903659 RepID=UPI002E8142DE|nr:zinc-binding dehydrogenase [Streptomyces sp. NBC_00503]WUD79772.1 zinc-binding dehydrogenase [Streptomyces sp. NBC_00503]
MNAEHRNPDPSRLIYDAVLTLIEIAGNLSLGLATALLLLTDAGRFRPGDSVLVHSAGGGIGSAIAQLVPLLGGGRLIGTVGRPEKAADVEKGGYDIAIARGDGLAEAIRAATDGHGVDLVLDPLGTTALARVAAATTRILAFLAEGFLMLPLTELPSLAEVPAAHDLLAEGRATGKYVARVSAVRP